MQATKTRAVNGIGRFDLLKGLGMIFVIISHTIELHAVNAEGPGAAINMVMFVYREALMSAFFLVSGYGFRQRPVGKSIQQQFKLLFMPYLVTALATSGLHYIFYYMAYRRTDWAVTETLRVLAGFGLGLPHTATYYGVKIFSCGPMWYVLTLCVGWVALDILCTYLPENLLPLGVAVTASAGWLTGILWEPPFCLAQGLMVTLYLYAGYLAKRKKVFDKPLPWWFSSALLLCIVMVAAGALLRQQTDSMAMARWSLGPLGILCNCVIGFWSVSVFLRLCSRQGLLFQLVEGIGRRSLYVFCVHTVELSAIPWYLFAARYSAHPVLGCLLQLILRTLLITLGCALIAGLRRLLRPLRTARAPAVRRRAGARH